MNFFVVVLISGMAAYFVGPAPVETTKAECELKALETALPYRQVFEQGGTIAYEGRELGPDDIKVRCFSLFSPPLLGQRFEDT